MKIIGLAAKAGGGKDTAGELIRESLEKKGYTTTQLSFANPLKDICTQLFGWDRDRLQTDAKYKESSFAYDKWHHLIYDSETNEPTLDPACEMLGMNRRVVMQRLGTEAMRRGLHSEIWIIALKLSIMRGDYDIYDYGLLTDCRFINELQFVRDLDGTLIRIDRAGEQSTLTEHTEHASELEWQEWIDWDAIIVNNINPEFSMNVNRHLFKTELENALGLNQLIDRIALAQEGKEIRDNILRGRQ
jgi:hypothetical protein